jgi:hypothetical protein
VGMDEVVIYGLLEDEGNEGEICEGRGITE